jgi:CelD/BcsL family acetyltransferase involved in cellulose biosynthesis
MNLQISRSPASRIAVETIADPNRWRALRPGYEALHRADPEAGIYLDWRWLDGLFAARPGEWRVLAAGDGRGWEGFLPLRVRLRWSRSRQAFQTRMEAAGRFDQSDYTGFVCDPDREDTAIQAIAEALAASPVARLSLRYEPTIRRARMLADALADRGFGIDWPEYRINAGTTDQLVCPVIALPREYDAWIDGLGRRMRKRIRRAARSPDAGIDVPGPDGYAAARDGLLALWAAKWDGTLPVSQRDRLARRYRDMMDRAQAMDALFLPTVVQGGQMIGASAFVLDRARGRAHALVEGRMDAPGGPDTGSLLMAEAVRAGIAAGFDRLDLGHGNADYKYRFGAADESCAYLVAERERTGIAPELVPEALSQAARMIRRGDTEDARRALRQIAG